MKSTGRPNHVEKQFLN